MCSLKGGEQSDGGPIAAPATSWPKQISEYPISHIDKLISTQIK